MKRAIKNNKPKDGNSSRPDIIDVDCIDRQRLAALIERGSCTTDTQATAAFGALLEPSEGWPKKTTLISVRLSKLLWT